MIGEKYLSNVATLKIDNDKCTGCKMCTMVCPHNVIQMINKKAVITDINSCMECNACANNCAWNAISVRKGVGCAAAVISSKMGKKATSCSCSCDVICN